MEAQGESDPMKYIPSEIVEQSLDDSYDWIYTNKMEFESREARAYAMFGAAIMKMNLDKAIKENEVDIER